MNSRPFETRTEVRRVIKDLLKQEAATGKLDMARRKALLIDTRLPFPTEVDNNRSESLGDTWRYAVGKLAFSTHVYGDYSESKLLLVIPDNTENTNDVNRAIHRLEDYGIKATLESGLTHDSKPVLVVDPIQPNFIENLRNARIRQIMDTYTQGYLEHNKSYPIPHDQLLKKTQDDIENELWGNLPELNSAVKPTKGSRDNTPSLG